MLETSTEELQEARDQLAVSLLKYVFFALSWPDMANSEVRVQHVAIA